MFEAASQYRRRMLYELIWGFLTAFSVYLLWSGLQLPRLGYEPVWFAWAWFILLAAPSPLPYLKINLRNSIVDRTFRSESCALAAMAMGLAFVLLLMTAPLLINYKFWLHGVFFVAVTLRLSGLALRLRDISLYQKMSVSRSGLHAGMLAFAGCLLIVPIVCPQFMSQAVLPLRQVLYCLGGALLWGIMTAALVVWLKHIQTKEQVVWLTFMAAAIGPLPALAVGSEEWFWLPGVAGFSLMTVIIILARLGNRNLEQQLPDSGGEYIHLYWLWRALLVMWWGLGLALALSISWWQPAIWQIFLDSVWLRAVCLGFFLIVCLGLLVEYSIPLLGGSEVSLRRRDHHPLGMILSTLAVLGAFTPLILRDPPRPHVPLALALAPRAELLQQRASLTPENPLLEINPPAWLSPVDRIYMVSFLNNAAHLPQGEAVAQLVVIDDNDIPHIFYLRVGVDTAEANLAKREYKVESAHKPVVIAGSWLVFEPTGEAFQAHSYLTGVFLSSQVESLKSLYLRYLYPVTQSAEPVELTVSRVFVD